MNVLRCNSGFSLVEVMCAILILGIALAGMTQGVSTALVSSKESELQTTAALLAAGLIETLRAEEYFSDGTTEGDCGEGLSLYRWKQSITSAGIDGLHEVEVVVENAKTGKPIYELRTLLFQRPEDSSRGGSQRPKDSDSRRRGGRQR
jgi:prepilin-type N-terminal cleavage/methylation domain-containing protein